MAVSPTPPSISILPPAPLPTDAEAVFDAKAGVRLTAEEVMVTEQNAALAWQAGSMAETKGYKEAAATSAGHAADSATAAADSATAATTNGAAQVELAAAQVGLATTQARLATANSAASETARDQSINAAIAAGEGAGFPEVGTPGDALILGAGNTVYWGGSSRILRSARTANVQVIAADRGKLIDITSGSFTQTFATVATLGDGWFCYVKVSGLASVVTIPLLDGIANFVMYPGETRIIQCDGTALRSVLIAGKPLMIVREEYASGIDPGFPASTAYLPRALNTVNTNSISGASLSGKRITLPPGTYDISGTCSRLNGDGPHKCRLYNVTSALPVAVGSVAQGGSSSNNSSETSVFARVTFTTATTLELQHRVSVVSVYMSPSSFGDAEVYSELSVEKVA